MGLFSKEIETMDDLFVHQLEDIYYAEKRIVGALPEMITKATSPQLKSAFKSHLGETRNHVRRVEQVFAVAGLKPMMKDCQAMGKRMLRRREGSPALKKSKNVPDAALIAAAQTVEHYGVTSLRNPDRVGRRHSAATIAPRCCERPWPRKRPRTRSSPR